MKIAVTGGAGYIGSVAADHLLRAGHEVLVIDNLSKGHEAAIPAGTTIVNQNINHHNALLPVLSDNVDALMHFAAYIEAGESMEKPGKYFANNVAATQSLLHTAHQAGIKHFVFSSTAGVYQSKDRPIKESDPLGPASVYGETKRMVEQMLTWYAKLGHFNVASLRYFNAAGATLLYENPPRGEAHQPETHLIPNIIMAAIQAKPVTINGNDYDTRDGTCVRDYIHVDDLVQAHLKALDALNEGDITFEAFNLGSGEGYSNKEICDMVKNVTGKHIEVTYGPRRPGDAASLVADSSKAQEILDWHPQHDLKDIIKSAWDWHRRHPHGY